MIRRNTKNRFVVSIFIDLHVSLDKHVHYMDNILVWKRYTLQTVVNDIIIPGLGKERRSCATMLAENTSVSVFKILKALT